MMQRCQQLRLALEARQPIPVADQPRRQRLDRNVAVEFGVAGEVDHTHAAAAYLAGDLVGADGSPR